MQGHMENNLASTCKNLDAFAACKQVKSSTKSIKNKSIIDWLKSELILDWILWSTNLKKESWIFKAQISPMQNKWTWKFQIWSFKKLSQTEFEI